MTNSVHGDSAEAAAYALFEIIKTSEAHSQSPQNPGAWYPSKDWVLSTYGQCLVTVKTGRASSGKP
jgi:hypothetical protein